jgi:hypothetical protein
MQELRTAKDTQLRKKDGEVERLTQQCDTEVAEKNFKITELELQQEDAKLANELNDARIQELQEQLAQLLKKKTNDASGSSLSTMVATTMTSPRTITKALEIAAASRRMH